MPDLGNICVQEHRDGIEIRRPGAADELLDHALRSPGRRLIFFCSCKLPDGCHRRTVAALVKRFAEARGIDVNIVEWQHVQWSWGSDDSVPSRRERAIGCSSFFQPSDEIVAS